MGFFSSTPRPISQLPFRYDLKLFMWLEVGSKDDSVPMATLMILQQYSKMLNEGDVLNEEEYQKANKILNGDIKPYAKFEMNAYEFYNIAEKSLWDKKFVYEEFFTIAKILIKANKYAIDEKMKLIELASKIFSRSYWKPSVFNTDGTAISLPFHTEDLCFLIHEIAVSDGQISSSESKDFEEVQKLLSEGFNLSEKDIEKAEEIMIGMIKTQNAYDYHANRFYNCHKARPELLELAIKLLEAFANSDGVSPKEKEIIDKVKQIFNLKIDEEESISETINFGFFDDLWFMLYMIASSDGDISGNELEVIEKIINGLSESKALVERAHAIFEGKIKSDKSFDTHLQHVYDRFKDNRDFQKLLVDFLNGLAIADGIRSPEEIELIDKVRKVFTLEVESVSSRKNDEEESINVSLVFDGILFMLYMIASSDGEISENELKLLIAVSKSFSESLNLSDQRMERVRAILEGKIKSDEPFETHVQRVYNFCKHKPELQETIVKILSAITVVDGQVSAEEAMLLNKVNKIFNIKIKNEASNSSHLVNNTPEQQTKEILKEKSSTGSKYDFDVSVKPKFCSQCGSKLKENSKFCPTCGSKIIIDSRM